MAGGRVARGCTVPETEQCKLTHIRGVILRSIRAYMRVLLIVQRTDLCHRWHNSGLLEVLGRCDHMVKVRGYSIHVSGARGHQIDVLHVIREER